MPSVTDMQQWLRERGYQEFENTTVQRMHRLGASKGDVLIRATEDSDGCWTISDRTEPRNKPKGTYTTVRDAHTVRSRNGFDHAIAQIETQQARYRQLSEVVRIALDKDNKNINGHVEPCCGVVLDSWKVDMSKYGMDFNDDGRWVVCGACLHKARRYDADGIGLCVRSIDGAFPVNWPDAGAA